ncbi:Nitrogen permease regulator 3 [Vanrija albida]|uniref:Nitrogen permease regulator 3 n=1 Tax=Vanrija albida TaxID=181172 RepID=A0ABR3PZ08_9TREE
MAEHILGLLFVTSSASERHIFRYPPDPTSPLDRLSQPIYPQATYTARDTTVDTKSQRSLFPRHRTDASRGSVSASRPHTLWSSAHSRGSRLRAGSSDGGGSGIGPSAGGSIHSHVTEYGSEAVHSGSSSSSDDSDDGLFARRAAARVNTPANRRFSSETEGSHRGAGSLLKPMTEIPERTRRDSHGESEGTTRPGAPNRRRRAKDDFIEAQYTYALGYPLEFLADLLTPNRTECNRRFEIGIDDLVFLGHPVSVNADGQWGYPSDESSPERSGGDDEPRRVSRGRRMDTDGALRPVEEQPETPVRRSGVPEVLGSNGEAVDTPAVAGDRGRQATTIDRFHLVLILDKPDPKPETDTDDAGDVFNEAYREIAFKWTAAAFALQVKDNWVGRETRKIANLREKAILEGIPVMECLREVIEVSDLGRSLHELFNALHKIKHKPLNSLFSHLSTTLTVNVGTIPVTIVVPPRSTDTDAVRAAQEDDDDSASSDSDSDDGFAGLVIGPDGSLIAKQPELRVEPWQTLLILDQDEAGDSRDVVPRRGSKSQLAEDELINALLSACDVSKPLHEIAHSLRFDLDGIVIPLARELVQNKRAILIDVINIRLRTILMPTSVSDHERTLTQHSVRWQVAFPTLPPLIPFIAMLSSTPVPFRDMLPAEAQTDVSKREVYIQAITWLLRNDLVLQSHVRARVVASPVVKEAAWRRMWHRRRKRWLREKVRTVSMTSNTSNWSNTSSGVLPGASPVSDKNGLPSSESFAARVPRPAGSVDRTYERALEFTRTLSLDPSYLDSDSELEFDSDVDADGDGGDGGRNDAEGDCQVVQFSLKENEPTRVPKFHESFIFNPARAQKDEARWLRVIRRTTTDAVLQSRFDLCVQYLDGVATFEEVMYRTGLSRREVDRIAYVYRDHLVLSIHP